MRAFRFLAIFLALVFTLPQGYQATPEGKIGVQWLQDAFADSCGEGYKWDDFLNRCVLTIETAQDKQAASECADLTGEEAADCYKAVADGAVGEAEAIPEGEEGHMPEEFSTGFANGEGFGAKAARSLPFNIVNGFMVYYLLKRQVVGADTCIATSFWLLLAGGVIAAVGEASASIYYKSSMRNLVGDYKNEIMSNNAEDTDEDVEESEQAELMSAATDNQQRAFDYLIKQEEHRKTAAYIRGGAYAGAGVLYLAGAVMATVEALSDTASMGMTQGQNTCVKKNKTSYLDAPMNLDGPAKDAAEIEKIAAQFNSPGKLYSPQQEGVYCSMDPLLMSSNSYDPLKNLKKYWVDYTIGDFAAEHGFHHSFANVNKEEIQELTFRSVAKTLGKELMDQLIPQAYAQLESNSSMDKSENFIDENGKERGSTLWDVGQELLWILSAIVGIAGGAALLSLMEPVSKSLDTALTWPWTRVITGGVLGAYAGVISGISFAEGANAADRIEALEEIKKRFTYAGGAGFEKCDSRDDPSKPSCYCYLYGGEKNYARANSTVCLNKWGEGGILSGTNYNMYANGSGKPKGCVSNDGKYDGACNCRYAKKREKKCATISSNLNFGGLGNNAWMKGAVGQANAITNGQMSTGDVAAGTNVNTAMRLGKMLKKAQKNPKLAAKMKNAGKLRKGFEKLHKSVVRRASKVGSPRPLRASNGGDLNNIKKPEDILKTAKESMKDSTLQFKGSGGGAGGVAAKDNGMDFDFGLDDEASPGITNSELADAMDKEYEFKGDINNNPNQNLFDILTVRYQKSGLRRLFDDERKTIAEDAADTDINDK
jgi:hypothetical protein